MYKKGKELFDWKNERKIKFINKEKKEIEFLKNILCKDPNIPKEMKEFVERKEESVKNMEIEIGYLKSILNKKIN